MPSAQVAYFSMEIALRDDMPTYAGGLGVLAGDTVRAAADLGVSMVAVSLLARKGYFRQRLDPTGWQTEEPAHWSPESHLTELPQRARVGISGREVHLRAWRYTVQGARGGAVEVYLLDADLPENDETARTLTDYLYGGDPEYRLGQEVILGIGGVRMLRALGYKAVERYHMNEGHSSLLILELLAEEAAKAGDPIVGRRHIDAVRSRCVFTTHTPVPAGHDRFPLSLVHQVVWPAGPFRSLEREFCTSGELNLTYLGLAGSGYVNGVAKSHRDTAQHMYAQYHIESITNGIHVPTWASPPFQELFDRHIPDWRQDSMSLRYAISISHDQIRAAHRQAKDRLLGRIASETGRELDPEALTIGFARRATAYKRFALVFEDPDRLAAISMAVGRLQMVFAGKAHPHDIPGKEMIQTVFRMADRLRGRVEIVYLPGYDMELAGLLTAGVDLWLNTPQPPMEASGTSGMKAALNGVPSLSVLDGWWLEGCIEGVTGWSIGERHNRHRPQPVGRDADDLYRKLEEAVIPLFYTEPARYAEVMRHAIALNGSFFNTERMLSQYVTKAYF